MGGILLTNSVDELIASLRRLANCIIFKTSGKCLTLLFRQKTIFSRFLGSSFAGVAGEEFLHFLPYSYRPLFYNIPLLPGFILINLVSIVLFEFIEDLLNNYIRRRAAGDKVRQVPATVPAAGGILKD